VLTLEERAEDCAVPASVAKPASVAAPEPVPEPEPESGAEGVVPVPVTVVTSALPALAMPVSKSDTIVATDGGVATIGNIVRSGKRYN
jgi:hypothetical protein